MPSQVYVSRVWRLGEIVRWQDRIGVFQPGEGTGLGLSISWDIVTQQHGGTSRLLQPREVSGEQLTSLLALSTLCGEMGR